MRVRCVGNNRDGKYKYYRGLTVGEEYEVMIVDESGRYYYIPDGCGHSRWHNKEDFEIIKEDELVKKIKIKKWDDLIGLEGKDKWGNYFIVKECYSRYIDVSIHNGINRFKKLIYVENILNGGLERVLEELKMCGFDVEFIERPELDELQRLELNHCKRILGMEWIIIGRDGVAFAYKDDNKPTKENDKTGINWQAKDFGIRLQLSYDFLTFEDEEPRSIEELLKED